MQQLNQEIIAHWQQLRQMTYDILYEVSDDDLAKKLPFERSQTFGNQFYCMLGTQETFTNYIRTGKWEEWECSLNNAHAPHKDDIISKMQIADEKLNTMLEGVDLLSDNGDGAPLKRYLILVEHESHHQGQIINFIFAHDFTIPESWHKKWGLRRD